MKARLLVICSGCIMFTGLLLTAVNQYLLGRSFSENKTAIRRSALVSLKLPTGALE